MTKKDDISNKHIAHRAPTPLELAYAKSLEKTAKVVLKHYEIDGKAVLPYLTETLEDLDTLRSQLKALGRMLDEARQGKQGRKSPVWMDDYVLACLAALVDGEVELKSVAPTIRSWVNATYAWADEGE